MPTRSIRRAHRRREAAWALVLASLLTVGVLGVLLLNTSMQQQSLTIVHSQQRVSDLQQQVQSLSTDVERRADPATLASLARAMHMHPARHVRWAHGAGTGRR